MLSATQRLTLEEFLKLPRIEESPAWELIDGQAQQKPMPTAHHSILQKRLTNVIDQAGSDDEALPELRCTLRSNSVVPDITVIHRQRISVGNTAIAGAPDWMIEILSSDQSTTRLIAKIQACLAEGTQLGWLINPATRVIMVLWPDSRIVLLENTASLPVPPGLSLSLTVAEVFAWLG